MDAPLACLEGIVVALTCEVCSCKDAGYEIEAFMYPDTESMYLILCHSSHFFSSANSLIFLLINFLLLLSFSIQVQQKRVKLYELSIHLPSNCEGR